MKVPSVGGAGVGWTRVPLLSVSSSPGTTVVDTLILPSGNTKSAGCPVVAVALAEGASSKADLVTSGGDVDVVETVLTVVSGVEALVVVEGVVVLVVVEDSVMVSGAASSFKTVDSVEEAIVVLSIVEFTTDDSAEEVTVVLSAFIFTAGSTVEDAVEELTVVLPAVVLNVDVSVVVLAAGVVEFCASGATVVVASWLIFAS